MNVPAEEENVLEKVFPVIELTNGELLHLGTLFEDPIVQKYLMYLAMTTSKETCTIGSKDLSDKFLADAHRVNTGRLEIINTLLSIKLIKPPTQPENK